MAWVSTLPADPVVAASWRRVAEREEAEAAAREAELAATQLADRVERLQAKVHRIDMKLAGALSRDRWNKIQRRFDQQSVRSHGGYLVESAGYSPEIEHSAHWGQILSVR